jgi:hypothetical protein
MNARVAATHTFTVEKLDDTDGLMEDTEALAEAMVYTTEDFDGAFTEECGEFGACRTLTITLQPGKWNDVEPLEVEGYYGADADGEPMMQTDTIDLPAEVEHEVTLRLKEPFMFPPGPTLVTMPAQHGGRFTIGVGDAVAAKGEQFDDVRATEEGLLGVRYTNGKTDVLWLARGERLGIPVAAVLAEPTEQGVTLYQRGMSDPLPR